MKHTRNLLLYACCLAAASVLRLPAAIPLSWTVETSRAQPATFEAYQGETIDFEAALQAHGKPLEAPLNYSFFWQTNGMGSTYWEVSCPSSATTTNVLFATWLPAYDVGAKVYNCFIGSPSNIYHAAFQLRLRPSPGATPNALPLPVPVIDFARVRVLNPPWSGGGGSGVDTNAVIDIANATIETNALVVATTNRVAALETATNNLTSSVSSLQSSKADQSEVDQMQVALGEAYSMAASASSWGAETGQYKANRAESGHADEIAMLDAEGNPTRSGIAAEDVITTDGGTVDGDLEVTGNAVIANLIVRDTVESLTVNSLTISNTDPVDLTTEDGVLADSNGKYAHLSKISATDPTFSNEVATVASTVTPPPSPTLRLYDEVRQCYWLGKMVNGVMQWEVE